MYYFINKLRLIFNIMRYSFTNIRYTTILDRNTGKLIEGCGYEKTYRCVD